MSVPAGHEAAGESVHTKGKLLPRSGSRIAAVHSFVQRFALVMLTVAVCLVFSLLPETRSSFPTVINIREVLINQAPLTIIAMGAIIPLTAGSFDLSVGAVSGTSAVATATAMSRFHLPLVAALAIGICCGLFLGWLNGLLIARWRLNPFIITLGSYTLLTGVIDWYTGDNNIVTGISGTLVNFGSALWLGIPRVLYLVVIVVAATWYLLEQHPFGRQIQAIGSSVRAAELVGINVTRRMLLCFVLSGLLSGVTGIVMVATSAGAVISQGPDLLFPMLTVVFISATTIVPGKYNVAGAVIGVLFVAASVSGLTLLGAASWAQSVFDGATLIVAVAVSTLLSRNANPRSAGIRQLLSGGAAARTPDAESEGIASESSSVSSN